ncbi:MAG: PadR family transcriptional regulator [Actinomycetota bacterium]
MTGCLMLLLGENPSHGYEVTDRLKQWGFDLAGPGPVYRELRMLEEAGLVTSAWSAPQSGPVPRVYELTDEGRAALDQASDDLEGLRTLIDQFQARYRELAAAAPPPRPAPLVNQAPPADGQAPAGDGQAQAPAPAARRARRGRRSAT